MHLVVVVARFAVTADATADLAETLMADDRTATVWIEPAPKTSRLALDVAAPSWDDAMAEAEAFVTATAEAEIVSVGRPASPENLR